MASLRPLCVQVATRDVTSRLRHNTSLVTSISQCLEGNESRKLPYVPPCTTRTFLICSLQITH